MSTIEPKQPPLFTKLSISPKAKDYEAPEHPFDVFPAELRVKVFSYCDVIDKYSFASCSRRSDALVPDAMLQHYVFYNIAKGSLCLSDHPTELASDALRITDKNKSFLSLIAILKTDRCDNLTLDMTGCEMAMLSRLLSSISHAVPHLNQSTSFRLAITPPNGAKLCDPASSALWTRVVEQISETFAGDFVFMFRCGCGKNECTAIGSTLYKHWRQPSRVRSLAGHLLSPFDFFDGRFPHLQGYEDLSVYGHFAADMRLDLLRKCEKLVKRFDEPSFLLQLENCAGVESDPRYQRFNAFLAPFPVESMDGAWDTAGRCIAYRVVKESPEDGDAIIVRVWQRESSGELTVECFSQRRGSQFKPACDQKAAFKAITDKAIVEKK